MSELVRTKGRKLCKKKGVTDRQTVKEEKNTGKSSAAVSH